VVLPFSSEIPTIAEFEAAGIRKRRLQAAPAEIEVARNDRGNPLSA
jgi:hypothetical protein